MEKIISLILKGFPVGAVVFHLEGIVDPDGLNTKQYYSNESGKVLESNLSTSDRFDLYDLLETRLENTFEKDPSLNKVLLSVKPNGEHHIEVTHATDDDSLF